MVMSGEFERGLFLTPGAPMIPGGISAVPEEGVIKYDAQYIKCALPIDFDFIAQLDRWRAVLYKHALIGQDPNREQGVAFGNVSQRVNGRLFVITGTQTGGIPDLSPEHYSLVVDCEPTRNLLVAAGPIKASSEAMTHATVYEQDNGNNYVFHAHSPDIWIAVREKALDIPETALDVPYGTPEMASETARLFGETNVARLKIFSMAGHTNGIVTFGRTPDEAGEVMMEYLDRARALAR